MLYFLMLYGLILWFNALWLDALWLDAFSLLQQMHLTSYSRGFLIVRMM